MLIHKLDRVLWTLREATDYVAAQIIADLQSDPTRLSITTVSPGRRLGTRNCST